MFVASDDIGSNVIRRDNTALIFIDVKQAWGFIADDLARISQKYGVDFRIFATESGMEILPRNRSPSRGNLDRQNNSI